MLENNDIEKLFSYSTEMKDNDDAKKEKNNRRFEGICRYVPEVMSKVYELNKGITDAIQVVNEKYSEILHEEDIKNAMYELEKFSTTISNTEMDTISKACIIKTIKFKDYKSLLKICGYRNIKSISRFDNMKKISTSFTDGRLDEKIYLEEIKNQIKFFNELYENYTNICANNFYAFVMRYDLKTVKKKNILSI